MKKAANKQSNLRPCSEDEKTNTIAHFKDDTEDYVYKLKKGNNNILVAVRARCVVEKEQEHATCVKILNEQVVLIDDLGHDRPEDAFRVFRPKAKPYAFDFAFGEEADQHKVYMKTTKFLTDGLFEGYNATVFCYGATGAGKTYTMLGTKRLNIPFSFLQTIVIPSF